MSWTCPVEVECGGIKCRKRVDGSVEEYDKFSSQVSIEPWCVKGVPCVFIMTDKDKRDPYGGGCD